VTATRPVSFFSTRANSCKTGGMLDCMCSKTLMHTITSNASAWKGNCLLMSK